MKLNIKYFIMTLLGEEDLQFDLDSDLISKNRSIFIKTGYGSGYSVDNNELSITIRRKNKLTEILALTPLYYFKGAIQQGDKEGLASGHIKMVFPSRFFFLTWFFLVFLCALFSAIIALYTSIYLIISFSPSLLNYLLNSGIVFGMGILLLVFGFMLLNFIKFIFQNQKNSLIEFCKTLHKSR